ncbi:MAG: FIST signal transduction protein [Desulfonatronovibrionaceae bacterium]
MRISVFWTRETDAREAAKEVFSQLSAEMPGTPDMVFAYYTEALDPTHLARSMAEFAPNAAVHGGSTCQGVLVNSGFVSGTPGILGVLALHDPDGDFGTSICEFGNDPEQAAAKAVRESLSNAGRPGESPLFVWISSTPGREEKILAGIESVLGPNIPVLGGSAADDAVAGNWSVIGNGSASTEGVAVTSFFPSQEPGFSFHSGYSPTSHFGVATETEGRILKEIDGRPAALVYNDWTEGAISSVLPRGGDVLGLTSWYPLARFKHQLGKVPL